MGGPVLLLLPCTWILEYSPVKSWGPVESILGFRSCGGALFLWALQTLTCQKSKEGSAKWIPSQWPKWLPFSSIFWSKESPLLLLPNITGITSEIQKVSCVLLAKEILFVFIYCLPASYKIVWAISKGFSELSLNFFFLATVTNIIYTLVFPALKPHTSERF